MNPKNKVTEAPGLSRMIQHRYKIVGLTFIPTAAVYLHSHAYIVECSRVKSHKPSLNWTD